MLEQFLQYVVADRDYYRPLGCCRTAAPTAKVYRVEDVPAGWTIVEDGPWTQVGAPDQLAKQGWKVHVSAQLCRAQDVLDAVALSCFEAGVTFKYLGTEFIFKAMHHKYGPRVQAGKFCAAYPRDAAQARRLMEVLSNRLTEEDGPYILTDRRFRDSRVIHYRYGSYQAPSLVEPDGSKVPTISSESGEPTRDLRLPRFVLPAGITDPFGDSDGQKQDGPITVGGYEFTKVLRHSSAGGSYLALDPSTGTEVFVREARAFCGLHWDGVDSMSRLRHEYRTLVALYSSEPDVCPKPLDYFREWEHEFMVTELVPGIPLDLWIARNNPIVSTTRDPSTYGVYYDRCSQIVDELSAILDRLHRGGYRHGDLSLGNVLVDDHDRPHLIDFEAATKLGDKPSSMGTPGFVEPSSLEGTSPTIRDDYGLEALGRAMLMPINELLDRRPENVELLRRDLDCTVAAPGALWEMTTRLLRSHQSDETTSGPVPPSVAEIERDPRSCLEAAADALAAEILSSADPGTGAYLFPTTPAGYETNPTSVSHGAAGVLHAMKVCGYDVPPDIRRSFVKLALDRSDAAPAGLLLGNSGVACVLADLGALDEAEALLAKAVRDLRSNLSRYPVTLATGVAGVAYACLWLSRRTSDERLLEQAEDLSNVVRTRVEPTEGDTLPAGLMHGWAGLAWLYHAMRLANGADANSRTGLRCLRHALAARMVLPDGGLSFHDGDYARRALPYLEAGTAGVLRACVPYLPASELAYELLPAMVDDVDRRCTAYSGLYKGLAGLTMTLSDIADVAAVGVSRGHVLSLATSLLKYLLPSPTGNLGVLGEWNARFSTDLASGAAGVLLAIRSALDGPRSHLLNERYPNQEES